MRLFQGLGSLKNILNIQNNISGLMEVSFIKKK